MLTTEAHWGAQLGRAERSVMWWIGDWWAYGAHRYGDRAAIVQAPDWTGPSYETCRRAAVVARQFETCRRLHNLSWSHHAEVAALPHDQAEALLERAASEGLSTRALSVARIACREKKLRQAAGSVGNDVGTERNTKGKYQIFTILYGEYLGGAKGNRTPDLLNAIQALSQLSYGPPGKRRGISATWAARQGGARVIRRTSMPARQISCLNHAS